MTGIPTNRYNMTGIPTNRYNMTGILTIFMTQMLSTHLCGAFLQRVGDRREGVVSVELVDGGDHWAGL